MKITDIKILRADRYLFINVETDAGITGIGEAGAWSFPEATIGALMEFRSSLIGEDPFLIEHHWQSLYRWTYFRGSIISSAISAIDIALWDIKGKALGVHWVFRYMSFWGENAETGSARMPRFSSFRQRRWLRAVSC